MRKHATAMALAAAVLAAAAPAAIGGVALASGTSVTTKAKSRTSVTIKAKGEYRRLHRRACGKTKDFRVFHSGSLIEFRGFVTPHPVRHFPVRIQLKRCVRGHWRDIGNRYIIGKKLTGKYKGFFPARPLAPRSRRRGAILYYSARAIVAGGRSPKTYFAVTR